MSDTVDKNYNDDTRITAVDLLHGLVAIPSLSKQEAEASNWLTGEMDQLGYDRAYVDSAGNAVGEMGDADAQHVVILLGHIDTVPGNISVSIENVEGAEALFGRGSVDAKGPLATFVMAGSRLGGDWARHNGLRLVVVGAVEEEAATSRGARFIRDRFDGQSEPVPVACIIGEPSGWHRITLGYKGRLLVEMLAGQPMAHSAGPDAGVATRAVAFWNWLDAYANDFSRNRDRVFDQLQPSLRELDTGIDEQMYDTARALAGIRLPLEFDAPAFADDVIQWCAQQLGAEPPSLSDSNAGLDSAIRLVGNSGWIEVTLRGYEPAWRSERNTGLVRSFLGAIRQQGIRPGFVVKTGTSDMNVVGPGWRCPILAYGPGDSSLDHTPNEHIVLSEYLTAIDVLEESLKTLALTFS